MKKTLTVLIMMTTLLFISNGIAQVELGLQGGINLGDVSLDPTPEGTSTSTRTGIMFGGVLFYSFSPILGLQVEPAFVQKGAKVDISGYFEGTPAQLEATLTGDYLDIPVLLKASFGDGPVKPYLLAGASVAFLLGDVKLKLDKVVVSGMDITSLIPSSEREEIQQTTSTDFILNFGGGVVIPLGQVNIFIEGQYNLGMTDLNDEPDDDTKIKSTGIQIKAGALFPL